MGRETGYTEEMFTHEQYRRAGVARILNEEQIYEFYYRGKLIKKDEADRIVEEERMYPKKRDKL